MIIHDEQRQTFTLPDQPAFYGSEEEAQTLVLYLEDAAAQVTVELYFGVFEAFDLITRSVRVVNHGKEPVRLFKCTSLSGLCTLRLGFHYL